MDIFCDFSGVYSDAETVSDGIKVDLRDIDGVSGYCSDEAGLKIREKIADLPSEAVHIIDGGNYHYMSFFWLKKIKKSFDLIVFDHHTDMQEPALIPALSCGSWLLDTLKRGDIPVNKVWLIGPPAKDFEAVEEKYKDRIIFVPQDEADRAGSFADLSEHGVFGKMCEGRLPVYISIDKDVLSKSELNTNWEQGSMSVSALKKFVRYICEKRDVIGIDLCGEPDIHTNGFSHEKEKSRKINEMLSILR